jgi:mRNA interferase HigB
MFLFLEQMRIIAKSTLRDFWEKHTDCKQALLSWYKVAKQAKWENFNEVKAQFGTCKILGVDRIVFRIKGNNYRLVVKITFTNQIIWIRFIGTHAEYDSIDAKEI